MNAWHVPALELVAHDVPGARSLRGAASGWPPGRSASISAKLGPKPIGVKRCRANTSLTASYSAISRR